jgi:predicted 2-oxoglutarate/Fe(II)-dependent dioxygenase YbiX/peroxiredoxin
MLARSAREWQSEPMSSQNLLESGDHAPWFTAPVISGSSQFAFNTIAGRYVLLLFFGSAEFEAAAEALRMVRQAREHFDDECACFFGVSVDPQDEAQGRIARELPGIRFFLDYDRRVSSRFGAVDGDRYLPHWLLLRPSLQVMERFALDEGQAAISALQKAIATPVEQAWAPVISVPNVLELSLCRELIELYECNGGEDSGFMRDVNGQTVGIVDHSFKQRRDYTIENEITRRRLQARMKRRLFPAIERAFQFQATRMERYMVACYEASAGHFKPHRDNTTKGTAHRKFAVTINLNSTEYEGGNLRFPEFGRRTYRAPTGGAIVFSCSLLHEATPVTSGRRYAFLPFLYDEEAARVREANSQYLATGGTYKA